MVMDGLLELTIGALGNRVGGIASGGPVGTVFVPGALPGEKVTCRITSMKKTFADAELVDVLETSPERVIPFCALHGECGGCSLQHLEYAAQLRWKKIWVERALDRGGIRHPEVAEVLPSPLASGYRNRVSFDITGGKPAMHRFRGDLMPVDGCPLLNSRGSIAFESVRGMDLSGFSRVSVRASDATGEAMIEFHGVLPRTVPPSLPRSAGLAAAWESEGRWRTSPPGVLLHERLLDCIYHVAPGGFFQVNTGAAGKLVTLVLEACQEAGSVLDLYGGQGTFAVPLAMRGAAVDSVEIAEEATIAGRRSAEANGAVTARFVTASAEGFLTAALRDRTAWDTVILDPPRSGLEDGIAGMLRTVTSRSLIYVSCNPFSMARDLRVLTNGGWALRSVCPVDMFPQTDHVETVATLLPECEG
jgi:23S rRNA (uracil1939-C5)-methyltransferase